MRWKSELHLVVITAIQAIMTRLSASRCAAESLILEPSELDTFLKVSRK